MKRTFEIGRENKKEVTLEYAKKDDAMVAGTMITIDIEVKCGEKYEGKEDRMTRAEAMNDMMHNLGLLQTDEWWKVNRALSEIKLNIRSEVA